MKPIILLSTLLLIFTFSTKGSVPNVINYTTKEYNGHSINYDIEQDTNDIIYIANAYCVLEYDGKTFRKIPLVQGKSAISLSKNSSGKIFIGSSSEFGCLEKDSTQKTYYKSLKTLIPGNKEINEIFDLHWFQNAIYFACSKGVYRFKQGKIEIVKGFTDESLIEALTLVNGKLLYWENGKGLGMINGLKSSIFYSDVKTNAVRGIQLMNNNYLIFGSFGVKTINKTNLNLKSKSILSKNEVSSVLQINKNEFLLGTVENGIYLMLSNGKLTKHLTTEHGLQSNFIRNLFRDKVGNIWIAYNNGIGILKWSSPVRYITNNQGFTGMGYTGIVFNKHLYIGTSRGLYKMKNWKNGLATIKSFEKVDEIPEGNINYLDTANGQLIVCQAAETYSLKNNKIRRISDGSWYGSWIWKQSSQYNKKEGFVGTYEGLDRYVFQGKQWVHKGHIKGYSESSRVLEVDDRGVIWSIQGNKGLYRVELNERRDSVISLINYSDKKDFNSDDFNDIFYLNKRIYISTFKGVYSLNKDTLIRDYSFDQIKSYTERIRKYDHNNIYGIYKDQAYLLEKKQGFWQVKSSEVSFARSCLVGSAEFFNKIDSNLFLIGTQEGFATYTLHENTERNKSKCLIRNIEIIGEKIDSMLFYGKPSSPIKLNYADNNLRITFSIPEFGAIDQVVFQTQLYRNKKKLSNWQNVKEVNYREFTNLREGNYTFEVRAKKNSFILGSDKFTFTVFPPWYKTNAAYAIYLLALLSLVLIISLRFKKQAVKLKSEKERELEIKERLHKTEKLEIELKNKENELAYMALSYAQKKEILASVETKLDALSKELESSEKLKINSLKKTISSSVDDESNWENFQIHFDQKNDNFFKKLKEVDNKLSESYLLFCSYVKMGKSNKEIAGLMNISLAAVEKRKYRLKKKWGLENEMSFTNHLRSL